MGLKIYRNDGVIHEMTEGESYDTGAKRIHRSEGGEQGVKKKKRKVNSCFFPTCLYLWVGVFSTILLVY